MSSDFFAGWVKETASGKILKKMSKNIAESIQKNALQMQPVSIYTTTFL